MKSTLRVAAVQLSATTDKAANLAAAEKLIRQAAAGGAELIVLPELFNLYNNLWQAATEAEAPEGETASLLQRLAKESNAWLIGGSFAEIGTGGKAFNTSLTIDPAGVVRGIYRKLHLFDVDLGETLRVKESDNLLPGKEIGYVETPLANIGISICYDLRFPEVYREQSHRGAELLCIPAAFTQKTGRDHWQLLIRARAVENQCYVIAANQVGEHTPGSISYGHSLVVDPWGKVLAEGSDSAADVIFADLTAEVLNDIRRKLPALQHRIIH